MTPEELQKQIESAAKEEQLRTDQEFTGQIYQSFKKGANFALPLGEEKGFRLAIELMGIWTDDFSYSDWLEQEGKRLRILK